MKESLTVRVTLVTLAEILGVAALVFALAWGLVKIAGL
jgi:hypothetical protein